MDFLVSHLLDAAFLVVVLALVAVGLAVVFGMLGVINLAHGELLAIGAYTLSVLQGAGLSFWVALAVAPIVGAAFGALLERVVIRRLYLRPLDTILVTWGLSLMLQQALQALYGAAPRSANSPVKGTIGVLGTDYPAYRILVIGVGLTVLGVTFAIFLRSSFGLRIRAIVQGREMAGAIGIAVPRVSMLAFAVGSGLAAIAGVLIAPSVNVVPQMGANYLAPAFVAVILGGVTNIVGVLAGAAFAGVLQVVLGTWIQQTLAQAAVLVLAIVVIRFRPEGLIRSARVRAA